MGVFDTIMVPDHVRATVRDMRKKRAAQKITIPVLALYVRGREHDWIRDRDRPNDIVCSHCGRERSRTTLPYCT